MIHLFILNKIYNKERSCLADDQTKLKKLKKDLLYQEDLHRTSPPHVIYPPNFLFCYVSLKYSSRMSTSRKNQIGGGFLLVLIVCEVRLCEIKVLNSLLIRQLNSHTCKLRIYISCTTLSKSFLAVCDF